MNLNLIKRGSILKSHNRQQPLSDTAFYLLSCHPSPSHGAAVIAVACRDDKRFPEEVVEYSHLGAYFMIVAFALP